MVTSTDSLNFTTNGQYRKELWFTNLEQRPLNQFQQLPAVPTTDLSTTAAVTDKQLYFNKNN